MMKVAARQAIGRTAQRTGRDQARPAQHRRQAGDRESRVWIKHVAAPI
jgi:hypothetical protein